MEKLYYSQMLIICFLNMKTTKIKINELKSIINNIINENQTIPFDEEIVTILANLLRRRPYPYNDGNYFETANKLVNIQKKYIDRVRTILSAETIANNLFKYDQDILQYNPKQSLLPETENNDFILNNDNVKNYSWVSNGKNYNIKYHLGYDVFTHLYDATLLGGEFSNVYGQGETEQDAVDSLKLRLIQLRNKKTL